MNDFPLRPVESWREYTDPEYERSVLNAALPILNKHKAHVLGIQKFLLRPMVLVLDGIRWQIGPLQKQLGGAQYPVPEIVYDRTVAISDELASIGYRFAYLLWGEEQKEHTPSDMPRLVFDGTNLTWIDSEDEISDEVICIYDPVLIGLIRTSPTHAIWVKLGAWFD